MCQANLLISKALQAASAQLAKAGVPSPAVDAREIAEHVLAQPLIFAAREFTPTQAKEFVALIAQRAQRIPLQHLIQKMWFRYLELTAAPGVFIVRPETELIAGEAIAYVQQLQAGGEKNPLVLDLCSGSGAIAIAIATETQNKNVHAVELSATAFALAQKNNQKYGGLVELRHGDALKEFNEFAGEVAVIATNPPYLPQATQLSAEAQADPALALFGGGAAGLDFPRHLIERAAVLLRPNGMLVMEHDETQGAQTCAIARNAGFQKVQTKRDLTGRVRYLLAQK